MWSASAGSTMSSQPIPGSPLPPSRRWVPRATTASPWPSSTPHPSCSAPAEPTPRVLDLGSYRSSAGGGRRAQAEVAGDGVEGLVVLRGVDVVLELDDP